MADYMELAGRVIRKEATRRVIKTQGVATTEGDTSAPKQGAELTGTSYTVPTMCQAVEVDETRYPKRLLFSAIWESPLTRTEFQAL